jgi:Lrp/AsnC family leucine-responsive transcriptional regulator
MVNMIKTDISLDNLDMKILSELDENSRISVIKLAKKLRISREVAKYRLKRLIDSKVIISFTTMINPAKFDFIIYKIYLKLQNLSIEKEKELISYLNKNNKVFWLAKTNGNFDLIAGLYVKNIVEFNEFLLDFTSNFGRQIASRYITNTVYSNVFKKKYLLNKSQNFEGFFWGGIPKNELVDELSIKILKLIAENSRMPIVDICERLSTTPKTVISKIKYLEKQKVILGYRITLNMNKINKTNFKAMIYFHNINREKEDKFKKFCELNSNIIYYIKTIGEWDLELDIEIEGYKEFNELLNKLKINFGDIIKNIDSVYMAEEVKGELNIVQNL